MTLDELTEILTQLKHGKFIEEVASSYPVNNYDKSIEIIRREINLKTLDPRKTDVSGNLIDGD